MKLYLKISFHLFVIILLTIITQIGGLIYLICKITSSKFREKSKLKFILLFLITYLIFTLFIIPIISPTFGRERVKNVSNIKPANYLTVLLNRNYVAPRLNELLEEVANKLKNTNVEIHYLDANFPFINGFPLLPHLSHNDGKKIDISLIYESKDGTIQTGQKSISGYGVFEEPFANEFNQIDFCKNKGYFQYDYPKYLTFGRINDNYIFSKKGTKLLTNKILENRNLGKLFIEPHLKTRMNLKDSRIRYHGCRAVRHDDHIHIQLK